VVQRFAHAAEPLLTTHASVPQSTRESLDVTDSSPPTAVQAHVVVTRVLPSHFVVVGR
jgi:hypothetical protein